jgi:hypothetical protein
MDDVFTHFLKDSFVLRIDLKIATNHDRQCAFNSPFRTSTDRRVHKRTSTTTVGVGKVVALLAEFWRHGAAVNNHSAVGSNETCASVKTFTPNNQEQIKNKTIYMFKRN